MTYFQRAGQYIGLIEDEQQQVVARKPPLLFVLGPDEQLQTVIMPDTYYSPEHREQLNGEQSFQFSVPGDHPEAVNVAEGNLVAFRDPDQDFLLFEVKRVIDAHDRLLTRTAYCEPAYMELLDEHIELLTITNAGAEYAVMQALVGTRWQSGLVDSFGSQTTEFQRLNPVAALQQIVQVWGGELRFRVTITGTDITGRYVDLLSMRGSETGKRFEHAKDLLKVERTAEIIDIKTALYGYGKGSEDAAGNVSRLTFADVAWSVAQGDPVDKPLGQTWVGDPTALAAWGRAGGTRHRFGQFDGSDIEDASALLSATWAELQRLGQPLVSYRMDVADLGQLTGYEHEKVRLGDTVAVIDRDLGLRLKARIVELRRNLQHPGKSVVILGNFLPTMASSAQRTLALERKVADRTGIWNAKITEGVSYKSVYIDGDSGLRVLDEQSRERVRLGEYVAGKYGMVLYDATGNVVLLDQDGMLQTWQEGRTDSVDDTHPLVLNVYVPATTISLHKVLLRFRRLTFRSYTRTVSSGGSASLTNTYAETWGADGSFGYHTHTMPQHTHYVPEHNHALTYGIYDGSVATSITVTINDVNRTSALGGPFTVDKDSLDITQYLVKGQWNTISLGSSQLGRIDATVFVQAKMGV